MTTSPNGGCLQGSLTQQDFVVNFLEGRNEIEIPFYNPSKILFWIKKTGVHKLLRLSNFIRQFILRVNNLPCYEGGLVKLSH
jgi:hypothetical protein